MKYLITYSERRSIAVEVEAQTPDEAFDVFHNQRDFQESDWQYWGEETEVDPIPKSAKDETDTDTKGETDDKS